jgi:DNA polymerase-1
MFKTEGTLALVDADILLYRVGFTTQEEEEHIALVRMNQYIDEVIFNSGCSDYILYLTGSNNYRKHLYPEYKANRTAEKPKHFKALREYLIKHEAAEMQEDQEADDAMGIAQNENTVICSIDKDLLQVPGRHFNFVKNVHSEVTKEEGLYFFYQQLLTGDRVDNIPGLPKIGPAKAKKILGDWVDEQTCQKKVIEAYSTILSLDEEAARERINLIGKLLWIRQEEGQLWELQE